MAAGGLVERSLRRLKPEKHFTDIKPRDVSELPRVESLPRPLPGLLLDSTVYIDTLHGRLPPAIGVTLRAAELWHSTVTEAELIAVAGLLNPLHPATAKVVKQVASTIEQRPAHRILSPRPGGVA